MNSKEKEEIRKKMGITNAQYYHWTSEQRGKSKNENSSEDIIVQIENSEKIQGENPEENLEENSKKNRDKSRLKRKENSLVPQDGETLFLCWKNIQKFRTI